METINIYGENRFEMFSKTREACRGIVIAEGRILLTYEVNTDQYFLPGGGLEQGESLVGCCERELAEETGVQVKPLYRLASINEYYEEWQFISHYFVCTVTGKTARKLTEREAMVGLEPRWVALDEAVEIFSKHDEYKDNEMKRGAYQREHEALLCFLRHRIGVEEIPVERIDEFWDIHFHYLVEDGIIEDDEDKEYFQSGEYRDVIRSHMLREADRHHMIYFVRDGVRIGAAQYNIYQSEDGKCFILDFWVFPQFRGNGMGHRCFEALEQYVKSDGAMYYELNSTKENAVRFWKSLGFIENGVDEYEMPLMIRKNGKAWAFPGN